MHGIFQLWVYLAASPLLWLTATLAVYALADWIAARAGRHPLVNAVAISAALLVILLLVTGTPYAQFFAGAQFVHFLLGPATVALAVPLYRNFERVRATAVPSVVSLCVGSLVAIVKTLIAG